MFKKEAESEIDEILQRIDLLQKRFADEISKDDTQRILSKSLEQYFKPLNVNKDEFMAGIEDDIQRLSANLA